MSAGRLPAAWRAFREDTLATIWQKFLDALGYRRTFVYRRSLDGDAPDVTPGLPVSVAVLTEGEREEYFALRPSIDRATLLRRWNEGHLCFAVRHRGRIVGSSWTSTTRARIALLDRDIEVAPGDVYVYDTYLAPDMRGHRIAPAVTLTLIEHFRPLRYRQLVRIAWSANPSAHRANERAGFRRVGVVGYLKLGPFRRDFGQLRQHEVRS